MEKFIDSDKPYLAARYSKKKVGIGIGGEGAIMFITPIAGEDFDDEMIYTIELMRHANVMYEMLKRFADNNVVFPLNMRNDMHALLKKARGEQ